MDKLDENYLDLVRESLYKKQRVVSNKTSTVRTKNANILTLEIAGNEGSPKNTVKKRFKTKKETFKAKAKLQNKSKKKAKPKQVAFIDDTTEIIPKSSDTIKSSDEVKNRIATPHKNAEFAVKLKAKKKSPKLHKSQIHTVSATTKNLSPSLNEKDGTTSYHSNNQNLVLEQATKKDTNVKGKKRVLSESDSPKGNVKRKKEKRFEKKGMKLMFEDSLDEDSNPDKVFNDIGQTNKIVRKKKVKNKCTDKNYMNVNFTIDSNWQNNNWETLNYSLDSPNKEKTEKFVKKSKNNIEKTDDNKTSKHNHENGGNIFKLDHSNKLSSLILKNNPNTGTVSEKTTNKSNSTNKEKTEKFVKKSKNNIEKTDDNKTSKHNHENGGNIFKLDHSNKLSSLILKNNQNTGTVSEKTTNKSNSTNKEKTEKFVKKSKNNIEKTDDNKASKHNHENGGNIFKLDHSNKLSSLILKNIPNTGTVGEQTTNKSKKQSKEGKKLKLKPTQSTKALDSNLDSSITSTSSAEAECKPKRLKNSSNILEDPAEVSDSCDNESVVVKGLKFQRFSNLFAPTFNEQFLGPNNTLRIPQKYFVVSKDDSESDLQCEEQTSSKCKKNNSSRKLKNTSSETSLEYNKKVPTSESTELINLDSGSKKKEQKKNINILDEQILGKRLQQPISSVKDQETFDSQENLSSSSNSIIQISDESNYSLEILNDFTSKRPVIVTLKNKNKIVALPFHAKMHFQGLCQINILMGNIDILGASLGPSLLNNTSEGSKLYSPRGTALLCIENKRSLFVDGSVKVKLKDLVAEDLLDEEDATLRFESDSAIFMCSALIEPCINFIERYVSQKIFPEGGAQELRVDFKLQGSWNRIQSSQKWDEILETVPENSKTVICGGKGVGKSTFIRYAVNFLLRRFKKIRVIDLDPGQSEFYYPGCISVVTVEKEVFGPNYTHLLEPDSSILSHINVGYDIKKYLDSVQCLLESIKSMASLPTLVNFPGFTQGIGLDISTQTLKLVEPTLVIQINSKAHNKNYKVDLTADNIMALNEKSILSQDESVSVSYRFAKFDSLAESNEAWSLEARQGREINILAYFGKLMTDDISDLNRVIGNLYSINISALSITNLDGKAISPSAINANIVALCSIFHTNYDVFSCHGYGFVRGIDLETDTLVLLTPETIDTLDIVSHLVLSSVTTPPSLIMTASDLKGHIPYVSVGEPVDFAQFTKRSYLPPRK